MADEDKPEGKSQGVNINELRYMQQVYQNQYAMITNSVNMVLRELQELNSAQKTLENMNVVEGKDILMGIGGDFYLPGSVKDVKAVLVGVGAGYVVEKDSDSAKAYVADLIGKNTENLGKLTRNRKELEKALMDISYRIENTV